jgi:hypothetical protein
MAELTIKIPQLSRRRIVLLVSGLLLAIGLALGTVIYLRHATTVVGLPPSAYQGLDFPVFFPRHAPTKFKLDPSSINTRTEVLAYVFNYGNGKPVYVSIQPVGGGFDTSSFRPTREFDAPIGHAYLATFENRTTVAIIAGRSLVLINSINDVPDTDIERFADSLTRAN